MNEQEWLKWRTGGIGSSDAPVIMGISPWKTVYQLWEEKTFGPFEQSENSAMARGKELEPIARDLFSKYIGVELRPKNETHEEFSWIRASLDGIDIDGKVVVEIKCPNRDDHLLAVNKKIPEKYYPQVQHQLLVTGLDGMYYYSFDGKDGVVVEIERDQKYIDELFSKEKEFWEMVLSQTPPKMTDKDYISMDNHTSWRLLSDEWSLQSTIKAEAEMKEKEIRAKMIELSQSKNARGNGVSISKSTCQGNIDYKQALSEYLENLRTLYPEISFPEISYDSYRKDAFEKWTFRSI